jgi:hypothetical protein
MFSERLADYKSISGFCAQIATHLLKIRNAAECVKCKAQPERRAEFLRAR